MYDGANAYDDAFCCASAWMAILQNINAWCTVPPDVARSHESACTTHPNRCQNAMPCTLHSRHSYGSQPASCSMHAHRIFFRGHPAHMFERVGHSQRVAAHLLYHGNLLMSEVFCSAVHVVRIIASVQCQYTNAFITYNIYNRYGCMECTNLFAFRKTTSWGCRWNVFGNRFLFS